MHSVAQSCAWGIFPASATSRKINIRNLIAQLGVVVSNLYAILLHDTYLHYSFVDSGKLHNGYIDTILPTGINRKTEVESAF
jgi:hypothetical protein